MQSQNISSFPFLLLLLLVKFLIVFQFQNGTSTDPSNELYEKCGGTFNCGSTVTDIGYPFRGINTPEYCGHPDLVLSCDDDNVTSINIRSVRYRVLEIGQSDQIMRIAREDIMRNSCPTEMVNTTLDYSVFDYAASYMNYTLLYGCSFPPDFFGYLSCGAYVHPGAMGPQDCNASVVLPGPLIENGVMNITEFEESLHRGFEIRWKIGSGNCSDCIASRGRCGYDSAADRTACYCSYPPYVSDVCALAPPPKPKGMYSSF